MDADSTFEDLANLARKARIDFGAEIRFLTAKQLPKVVHDEVRPFIGPLESLKRGTWVDVVVRTKCLPAGLRRPIARVAPWLTPPWRG